MCMHCEHPSGVSRYGKLSILLQNPSNRFAMRNRFSVLFSVLGISLMMLLTAASSGTLHAQCNTAPAVGPVNYTINMGGTQAIITQASLAGVVNPVNGGIAPCNAPVVLWRIILGDLIEHLGIGLERDVPVRETLGNKQLLPIFF